MSAFSITVLLNGMIVKPAAVLTNTEYFRDNRGQKQCFIEYTSISCAAFFHLLTQTSCEMVFHIPLINKETDTPSETEREGVFRKCIFNGMSVHIPGVEFAIHLSTAPSREDIKEDDSLCSGEPAPSHRDGRFCVSDCEGCLELLTVQQVSVLRSLPLSENTRQPCIRARSSCQEEELAKSSLSKQDSRIIRGQVRALKEPKLGLDFTALITKIWRVRLSSDTSRSFSESGSAPAFALCLLSQGRVFFVTRTDPRASCYGSGAGSAP